MSEIITCSGAVVSLLSPIAEDLPINDLIRSIARIPRFNGHTLGNIDDIYSVAQHSVLVSSLVPEDDAFAALIHDLHEGVIGDITTPVKQVIGGNVEAVGNQIQAAIHKHFGLPWPLPASSRNAIDAADREALKFEVFYFMPENKHWDFLQKHAYYGMLKPMKPSLAYELFLTRFNGLCPENHKQEAA